MGEVAILNRVIRRDNGGVDQSESSKGNKKCQSLKGQLPGFDDSISVE